MMTEMPVCTVLIVHLTDLLFGASTDLRIVRMG